MAGIIGNSLANGQTTYGADTSKYDATTRSVNPDTETAAGQLRSLLSSGSPYLTQARTGAMQTAQSRGLLNSSMAAGAGEAAAIAAAQPFAINDAGVYERAATANQGFENAAGQFNAGATNTANLNSAASANNSMLSTQQTGQQKELAQQAADILTNQTLPAQTSAQKDIIGAQTTGNIAQTQAAAKAQADTLIPAQTESQKQTIAATGEQTRQNIAAQAQATAGLNQQQITANAALEATKQQLARDLQSAQTDADKQKLQMQIDANAAAAAKVADLQKQLQTAQTDAERERLSMQIDATQSVESNRAQLAKDLQAATTQADKDRLLTQIDANTKAASALGTLQKELQSTDNEAKKALLGDQIKATADLETQRAQLQKDLQSAQTQAQKDLLQKQIDANSAAADKAFSNASTLQKESSAQKIEQLVQQGKNDEALQTLKESGAESLANIEGAYRSRIQASSSASNLFNLTQKNVNDILADPNTSVAQKQSAVDAQTQLLEASLAVQGGLSDSQITALLDFTGSVAGVASNNAMRTTGGNPSGASTA